ncbi:MAG: PAS domain S-box protein [Desulfosalsimonadaceae bacterium]
MNPSQLEELETSLRRYADLYHNAPVAYVTVDRTGLITNANLSASELLGMSADRLIGRGFSRFIHPEDHKLYFSIINHIIYARGPRPKGAGEIRLLKSARDPFYISIEMAPSHDEKGRLQGWNITFMDISENINARQSMERAYNVLKDSEAQMTQLSSRLLEVQEEERKRIAKELHDSVGQMLAAMKISLETAIQTMRKDPSISDVLVMEKQIPTLQLAIDDVRTLYMGLRPTLLDDLGLLATIQWFCRRFCQAHPVHHVEFDVNINEEEVPDELKTVVFRVIQEAFDNIAKHSQADEVILSLRNRNGKITLFIEDKGVGVDVAGMTNGEGKNFGQSMGIAGIRERVELSGGTFSFTSSPGQGTRVQAVWEVEPEYKEGE